MKKFTKLVALALAGTMMLMMTACGGALPKDNEKAQKQIVKAINEFRTDCGLPELKEVEELSDFESLYMNIFVKQGSASIHWNEIDHSEYDAMYEDIRTRWSADWGDGSIYSSATGISTLNMPVSSMETIKNQIKYSGNFFNTGADSMGVAVVTIDGVTYWGYSLFCAKAAD